MSELWAYLKDTVCSNNPLSVDDLVDKLMTAVTAIPQPLLNSVVKDTIKKQKSIDEGEWKLFNNIIIYYSHLVYTWTKVRWDDKWLVNQISLFFFLIIN